MYQAYITRIKNVEKHFNADSLQVGQCFGSTVIVGMDTQDNELGIYFPIDGKLGVEYATKNALIRMKDDQGNNIGGYLDPEKRNIRALKLRGAQSDGLFMPLKSLESFTDITKLKEGDTIDILNKVLICEKYIPKAKTASSGQPNMKKRAKKAYANLFPLFEEHKDTAQLMYNLHAFNVGDFITLTLKMHGTSHRIGNLPKEDTRHKLLQKFFPRAPRYENVSGTRRVVLNFSQNEGGYYADNSFRKKWHDIIAPKLHKGETIYFEILGWVAENTLIMPECQNKKVQDKEFTKQYGATTQFTYGCERGENTAYVYRMTYTNEDGFVVEYPTWKIQQRCEEMALNFVPVFEQFIYTTETDLIERIEKYCGGVDPIGKTHVREGVVARIENKNTFVAYKHKNFEFKVLEGIIKEEAVVADMEEAQENV